VKRWQKLLFPLLLLSVMIPSTTGAAPYEGYNYSWKGEAAPAPVPYLAEKQLTGEELGIGGFNSPEDMYITPDSNLYILDTGNNRIVQMDQEQRIVQIIDGFDYQGKREVFLAPQGIFVHTNGHIYVADTGHKRIIELTGSGQLVRIIGEPHSDVLPVQFVYNPVKLVVDSSDRLYVVAKGVFDGILQFDNEGKFIGFMGVNKVQYNAADLFWKQLMTAEQRSKMQLFIPVEFNNVAIDDEGFIYATTAEAYSEQPVKRLNPSGVDVLRRGGYFSPKGDIVFTSGGIRSGSPAMIAVTVDRNGIYSVLDNTRGRIFTYDRDGKLMYQFGQLGEQKGTFKMPASIRMMGNVMVLLDKGRNQLVYLKPTLYGETIRDAVIFTDLGKEEMAVKSWQRALELNNNLEIAYLGVGKAELRQGHNFEAMSNFKLGMHTEYYSRAFERYRKDFLWKHFGTLVTILIGAVVLLVVVRRVVKSRGEKEPGTAAIAWYTVFHPFKGYWELKFEKKGRIWFALLLLAVLALLYILKRKYTGFIFNPLVGTEQVNPLDEIKFILLPFFLWCIANWSLTTLMDGEGKFKEIVMATAYALVPLVVVQLPLILLSNIVTVQEASFYHLIESIAFIWFIGLLFVGMLTVHQFSASKTVVTMLLTLVVIGILIFLGLLFFSLLQQIISFVTTIYQEIVFRIGEG